MGPFAILSVLLRFPDTDVVDDRREVARGMLRMPAGPARDALLHFISWWSAQPLDELQRRFTATFDFSKRTSLDLTYYAYGDRRQRGLALLRLRQRYRAGGLELEGPELPDHLPVVLEFVDACPEDGGALLAEFRPVLELMRMALQKAESPWAGALTALCLMLPPLTDEERAELAEMVRNGPPAEDVGLEPFAPPEVMPPSSSRMPAPCSRSTP